MPRWPIIADILFALAGLVLVSGCGPQDCADGVEDWINEAPRALDEFLLIRDEVLADSAFVASRARGGLIFIGRDTIEYPKERLPRLMGWFRRGRGIIDMDGGRAEVYYRDCRTGRYNAWGVVYYERLKYPWISVVEMVDSTDLGNGWHAHVTTCVGCGDS